MLKDSGMIHRGRGLVDLIAGKTPTFGGWTTNPTDASNITDGDVSTFCTTGNKICGGGYQYGVFEWDLGSMHNVFCTGVGTSTTTAGTPYAFVYFWDGSGWINSKESVGHSSMRAYTLYGSTCSKIRLGITSTTAATITPNIREFHAWRLQ